LHVALQHCDCRPRNSSSPRPRQPFPSQHCNVFQKRMVYHVPLQSFTLAQDRLRRLFFAWNGLRHGSSLWRTL
jgi:hypothetical protein